MSDYDEQFPIAEDVSLLQQALPVMYPHQLHSTYCCNKPLPNRACTAWASILLMLGWSLGIFPISKKKILISIYN